MDFTAELFRFLVPAAIPSSTPSFGYCEVPRHCGSHHRTGPIHHPAVQARPSLFCPCRDPHPGCSGQESSSLTRCQTFDSPRLAAVPACSLSSPRSRNAVDSPQPAGCPRPLLPSCSPPPLVPLSHDTPTQPPLLGTTTTRGRYRRRSRVIPGSSAKLRPRPREPKAHPPRRTPPSCRAACHMTQP